MSVIDVLVLLTAATGAFFSFVAAFGVFRMPTALMRLHCSTKAATLGVGFLVLAAALHFNDSAVAMRALAVIAFLLLTAPIAAHAIARTAARSYDRDRDAELDSAAPAESSAAANSSEPPKAPSAPETPSA